MITDVQNKKEILDAVKSELKDRWGVSEISDVNNKALLGISAKYRGNLNLDISIRKAGAVGTIRLSFTLMTEDGTNKDVVIENMLQGNDIQKAIDDNFVTCSTVLKLENESDDAARGILLNKANEILDIADKNIEIILHSDSNNQDGLSAATGETVSDDGKNNDTDSYKGNNFESGKENIEDKREAKPKEAAVNKDSKNDKNEASASDTANDNTENIIKPEIEKESTGLQDDEEIDAEFAELEREYAALKNSTTVSVSKESTGTKREPEDKKENKHSDNLTREKENGVKGELKNKPKNIKANSGNTPVRVKGVFASPKPNGKGLEEKEPKINETERNEVYKKDTDKESIKKNTDGMPESVKQRIEKAYEEINKTLSERNAQINEREKNLNEYADSLKEKEKQLNTVADGLEKKYLKKSFRLEAEAEKKAAELEVDYENKYKELENSYLKKEAELEDRIKKAEDENERKAKELEEKENDIYSQFKELELNKKRLEVQIETIAAKEKNFNERKLAHKNDTEVSSKLSEGATKELDEARRDAAKYKEDAEKYSKDLVLLNDKIEGMDKLIGKYSGLISRLNAKVREFEKSPKVIETDSEEKTELTMKISDAEKEIAALNDKIESLEGTMDVLRIEAEDKNNTIKENDDKIKELEDLVNKLKLDVSSEKERADKLSSDIEKSQNVNEEDVFRNRANLITSELAKAGIQTMLVPGESFVISGKRNNVDVFVDIKNEIMYFEKAVKKASKYQKLVEEYNKEDIRTSYLADTTSGNIVCKCAYSDVLRAAVEITDKLKTLE